MELVIRPKFVSFLVPNRFCFRELPPRAATESRIRMSWVLDPWIRDIIVSQGENIIYIIESMGGFKHLPSAVIST